MHVFPAMLLGVAAWVAVVATASTKLYAVGAGPLIVSGVALAACIVPLLHHRHYLPGR